MSGLRWVWVGACIVVASVSLSACIAPDVEVIGAVGVTVDEQARPVLVVEACDGAATLVTLAVDREGLDDDEENEEIASWTSSGTVAGKSDLLFHAPAAPWQGVGVELPIGRGYIAEGQGAGDRQVLTQVAFNGADLAAMEPGTVYRNDPDLDVSALVGRTESEFSGEVCGRR